MKLGLPERITNYLANGGLFNPEMMEHDKVRDLLRDLTDEFIVKYSDTLKEFARPNWAIPR